MVECSSMFEASRSTLKKLPRLEKHGIVTIRFNGDFNSQQIEKILMNLHFIITVYKKGCKEIHFICDGNFKPSDAFVYVLFEVFIYTLRCKYNYAISLTIRGIQPYSYCVPGVADSLLLYFHNANYDKTAMEKCYRMVHNQHHFRRIVSKDDIEGASKLLSELKLFLSLFQINKDYGADLAKVASELVDNASEHAEADCLVDIYVSNPTYHKKNHDGCDYYAISMVIINFSDKTLNHAIRKKLKDKSYEKSKRYDLVEQAFEKHKEHFKNGKYEEDDFFNLAAFQDRISGRETETKTGGTGLTDLIKSLEDKAEAHRCYVLSGNKGICFEPEYLKYNNDNWIGFNDNNDFINEAPKSNVIVRSKVNFLGTGYNFMLIVKKENE